MTKEPQTNISVSIDEGMDTLSFIKRMQNQLLDIYDSKDEWKTDILQQLVAMQKELEEPTQ
jgi:hypothetical protein